MKKKDKISERELTEAEKTRLLKFEQSIEEYEKQGYVQTNHLIDIVQANLKAVLLWVPVGIVSFFLFFLIYGTGTIRASVSDVLLLMAAYVLSIFLHEWIHGIVFGCFAGKDAISYGFMKEVMTPYCTCSKPVSRSQYLLGVLMPTVILGIIPIILSLCTGNFWMLVFGNCMYLSGGGDILIAIKVLALKKDPQRVLIDHPTECGFTELTKRQG